MGEHHRPTTYQDDRPSASRIDTSSPKEMRKLPAPPQHSKQHAASPQPKNPQAKPTSPLRRDESSKIAPPAAPASPRPQISWNDMQKQGLTPNVSHRTVEPSAPASAPIAVSPEARARICDVLRQLAVDEKDHPKGGSGAEKRKREAWMAGAVQHLAANVLGENFDVKSFVDAPQMRQDIQQNVVKRLREVFGAELPSLEKPKFLGL